MWEKGILLNSNKKCIKYLEINSRNIKELERNKEITKLDWNTWNSLINKETFYALNGKATFQNVIFHGLIYKFNAIPINLLTRYF